MAQAGVKAPAQTSEGQDKGTLSHGRSQCTMADDNQVNCHHNEAERPVTLEGSPTLLRLRNVRNKKRSGREDSGRGFLTKGLLQMETKDNASCRGRRRLSAKTAQPGATGIMKKQTRGHTTPRLGVTITSDFTGRKRGH